MTRQFSLRFALFLFFSDLLLVALALLLATRLRTVLPFGISGDPGSWTVPLPVYGMGVAVWAVMFAALNVYDLRGAHHLAIELLRLVPAAGFAWLALAGLLYFTYREVSRLQYVYFLFFYLLLIVTHRTALRGWFMLRGGHRYNVRRVLIVGTGELACEIAQRVERNSWMGLVLAGYATDNPENGAAGLRVLGTRRQIAEIVQEHNIREVVLALPRQESQDIREFVQQLQLLPVNIRLVPDYFDLAFLRLDVESFGGVPLLSLKEPVLDPFQRLVKRSFDRVVATLLLIPALPLMGLIALLIRRDSPGPALFRQPRIGEGGRVFTMIKFRTMVVGAEAMQDQLNRVDEVGNILHKHEDDPRITRVGRFLRRSSLDELPQLFNILRGEMSLVGPRPEMPWLVEKYEPWQRKRFEVPQGLTGWWQVSGRADKPMHLHTEDDLYYIRNYSVWMDLRILWMTVVAVFNRRGAY